MIEVSVQIDFGQGMSREGWPEIAKIEIEKLEEHADGTADYSVRFGINIAQGSVAIRQRKVERFPRTKYNVLGLLSLCLQTLSPEELSLEHGTTASDLARRQRGARIEIPRKADDSVNHH